MAKIYLDFNLLVSPPLTGGDSPREMFYIFHGVKGRVKEVHFITPTVPSPVQGGGDNLLSRL